MQWYHWWFCLHDVTLMPGPVTSSDQKVVMLHLTSIALVQGMQYCHFSCHWHNVMPTLMPVLHIILIISTKQMAVVPLIMLLVAYDVNAGASGIIWPKKWCSSPFDYRDLTSGIMPLMKQLEWYETDTSVSGITWPKELCCTSFLLF